MPTLVADALDAPTETVLVDVAGLIIQLIGASEWVPRPQEWATERIKHE